MATINVGIIMNGVTGRMGTNQHLIRSIAAIRKQGGVALPNGDVIMPDPILVGRQESKLKALAEANGIGRWSTNLDEALADAHNQIYFDSQTTVLRAAGVRKAIAAGKHIYCEKPTAGSLAESLELAKLARDKGIKNGVVQDKLFLPGLIKLKRLVDSGFFGRILAVRMEFGYWVFEGDWQPGQRPSWNYRKEDGGGIIVDMFAHWRYVLDNLFGDVKSVSCLGVTHIPQRVDEQGNTYDCTADDAAYATFEIEGGIIAQVNSSWAVRVNRDDLVTIHVDGTEGSAVAGLRDCKTQHRVNTPKPVWNPDIPNPFNFLEQWENVPDNQVFDNGFKIQWELFLKHVVIDTPFPWDLLEGAKGTQLSELGLQSWKERRWVDVPELTL
ncbi:Gfo/Idh/MocA family protein [Paenibacillus xerothermodurans]|uniref:Gfo/Idh/MocA family oxidoreductase n=1 Tax=Paenibacillus xerothermodurans TaxID=1977292 RepID=A0A2W1NE28_PAEXE|nr:Gfo/Idh/MocA family oxidoreductase [Paenibacillus xerothermodurans]PZE22777.1 gfo/Idh/MocA family oxidoreductase [Paenibacillus xerothermodurans]